MKSTNLLLAAAVSGVLAGAAWAGDPAPTGTATATPATPEKHACKGLNSCKANGGCKTATNSCAGMNSCKGQGGCATAKHACTGHNDCKGQGGCKTAKNSCRGQNACKGQGGCATPPAAPTPAPAK